ncbi:hypothetical protein Trydic_g11736 [Trypoxylus dichotomus]
MNRQQHGQQEHRCLHIHFCVDVCASIPMLLVPGFSLASGSGFTDRPAVSCPSLFSSGARLHKADGDRQRSGMPRPPV